MNFDAEGDFAGVVDGLEPVRLMRPGDDDATAAGSAEEPAGDCPDSCAAKMGLSPSQCRKSFFGRLVAHAFRRTVTEKEAESSEGRYTTTDVVWHLPCSELAAPPRPGDVLVDAGGSRWTVLQSQQLPRVNRWRCTARNLAVAHGLDLFVDVEQAVREKSDSGAERLAWRPWRTGVPARIQPVEMLPTDDHQRRASVVRYRVFLAESLSLDRSHRLRGPDGTVYTITAARRMERIDALMEVEATSQVGEVR